MTTFGLDVSHYQSGLHVASAKAQGYEFLIAKCTEGSGYADPAYPSFHAQAHDAGLLFAAYHFLRSDQAITAQADNLERHIGDKTIPIFIDCEVSGQSKPTLAHCNSFKAACAKRGLNVVGLYFPNFWWKATGSPNLNGAVLWQAIYGANAAGLGSAIYPGDNSTRWYKQGGSIPTLLQFGSRGHVTGYSGDVDVDAFRGTRLQLAGTGLFKDYAPVSKRKVSSPNYAYIRKALASNEQHARDLRLIRRRKGSPFDLKLRAYLGALRIQHRTLTRRLKGHKP